MKTIPRWGIFLIMALTFSSIIVSVAKFAEKSVVFVRGSVKIAPELESQAKGIRTLFIVLYDRDQNTPMPYGAIKIPLSEDPKNVFKTFTITSANLQIMNKNKPLPSNLRVKARLDISGQAGLDKPGDLTGEISQIPVGSEGLTITINRLVST